MRGKSRDGARSGRGTVVRVRKGGTTATWRRLGGRRTEGPAARRTLTSGEVANEGWSARGRQLTRVKGRRAAPFEVARSTGVPMNGRRHLRGRFDDKESWRRREEGRQFEVLRWEREGELVGRRLELCWSKTLRWEGKLVERVLKLCCTETPKRRRGTLVRCGKRALAENVLL